MAIRKIIHIDEDKCNGCGLCIPNCAEGTFKIVDGKAKIIADKFCDGLGACLGHCPQGALTLIEREAEDFDEVAVEVHLKQIEESKAIKPSMPQKHQGCPGSRILAFNQTNDSHSDNITAYDNDDVKISIKSQLKQWPVQFMLVPTEAAYFESADLLITADCVPIAYPNYHLDILKGKRVIIGCPKLDNAQFYFEKLTEILRSNNIKSLTVAHMEVPCCSGMVQIAKNALAASGKNMPLRTIQIGVEGKIQKDIKA